jgi:hypothetical protein
MRLSCNNKKKTQESDRITDPAFCASFRNVLLASAFDGECQARMIL